MPKDERKYLTFNSYYNIFWKFVQFQGKGYTFSIPLCFQKIILNKFFLMLKNIKFSDTDKTIGTILHLFWIKMFLEAIPKEGTEGNSRNCRNKEEKCKKVNNNTNVIRR